MYLLPSMMVLLLGTVVVHVGDASGMNPYSFHPGLRLVHQASFRKRMIALSTMHYSPNTITLA
jgi:hypothetical protein